MRLKVQIVAAVLTVVTLICGCILMQYLTRKVSRQINALSDTIQNAAKGEIGIQAPVYMNDDIGKIARRFNEMSLQNKKLIEELVQAEAQKNSAKMEAVDYKYRFLHTQINPHFIYNSLETINAIAKVNHTPEVSRIVQLIGKYFRNITKYSDHQFIALEKEFELLQCFIDIYKNILFDFYVKGNNVEEFKILLERLASDETFYKMAVDKAWEGHLFYHRDHVSQMWDAFYTEIAPKAKPFKLKALLNRFGG